jgi:hypothetical protein
MTAMRDVTYRAGMSTSALARSVVDAAWRSPERLRRPWPVEVALMLVLTIGTCLDRAGVQVGGLDREIVGAIVGVGVWRRVVTA